MTLTKQQLHRFWKSNLANYILLVGLLAAGGVWLYGGYQQSVSPHICFKPWYNISQLTCYSPQLKNWVACIKQPKNETYPICSNTIAAPPEYTPLPSINFSHSTFSYTSNEPLP